MSGSHACVHSPESRRMVLPGRGPRQLGWLSFLLVESFTNTVSEATVGIPSPPGWGRPRMELTLSRKRCPGEAQGVDVVSPGKGPSCPAGSGTKALGGGWWWLGCGRE